MQIQKYKYTNTNTQIQIHTHNIKVSPKWLQILIVSANQSIVPEWVKILKGLWLQLVYKKSSSFFVRHKKTLGLGWVESFYNQALKILELWILWQSASTGVQDYARSCLSAWSGQHLMESPKRQNHRRQDTDCQSLIRNQGDDKNSLSSKKTFLNRKNLCQQGSISREGPFSEI